MTNFLRSQRFCFSSIFIILTLLLIAPPATFAENETYSLRSLSTPPKLLGAKAKHAWRLYKDYKTTLTAIKKTKKNIRSYKTQIENFTTAGPIGGSVALAAETDLIKKLIREREILEKNQHHLTKLKKAWNNNFRNVIGKLSHADTMVKVKYNKDPSRPLEKREEIEMDKIELRLRAWHSTDGPSGRPIEKPAAANQPTIQNTLTAEERRTLTMNKLQQLSHKKLLAVMKDLGIKVPVSFYNCLCRNAGYGSGGTDQFYHPDTLGEYDKRYTCQQPGLPCIVSGYGCTRYPLPSDPEVWKSCMENQRVNMTKNEDGKNDPDSGERLDVYIERLLRKRN